MGMFISNGHRVINVSHASRNAYRSFLDGWASAKRIVFTFGDEMAVVDALRRKANITDKDVGQVAGQILSMEGLLYLKRFFSIKSDLQSEIASAYH